MGKFRLPIMHQPGVVTPPGGSCCANCKFYIPMMGTFGGCSEPNYQRWAETPLIPCPPDRYCTDWWQAHPSLMLPQSC